MNRIIVYSLASAFALAAGVPAQAALTTYVGADDNVSSLAQMTNSLAAAASYDAATPGSTIVDFESALPASVTITGGNITNVSGCGALCGFNTTALGANFLSLVGGSTTFSFTNAVNSFGFYVTGLQTNLVGQQTVTFSNGQQQTINFPTAVQGADGGGGAFIGFTDFGKSIASVTIDVSNDIVAIDDVRFGFAQGGAVPEPATWAMLVLGFGTIGGAMRSRRKLPAVRFA